MRLFQCARRFSSLPEVVNIAIVFCEKCRFRPLATGLAEALCVEAKRRGLNVEASLDGSGAIGTFDVHHLQTSNAGASHLLWSKAETGEPTSLDAAKALGRVLVTELRVQRLRDKTAVQTTERTSPGV